MNQLTITTIQTDLHWEDKAANRTMLEQKIRQIDSYTDIIILPEMFSTGFSMNASQLAESMDGTTVNWMKKTAKEVDAVLTGSIIIQEGEKYYNRMLWVQPDGNLHHYDKKHLFTMASEEDTYSSGTEKVILDYKGWKIALFVCYDLRFPAWCRNLEDYEVAIYVASWPAKRAYHWCSLLPARAIENQAYTFAVNRVGVDGNGFEYNGDSMLIDPAGTILYHQPEVAAIQKHTITKEHLAQVRQQFPFLRDRDSFEITKGNELH